MLLEANVDLLSCNICLSVNVTAYAHIKYTPAILCLSGELIKPLNFVHVSLV